jgi:tetratricopeptide (TPR) repeat protein
VYKLSALALALGAVLNVSGVLAEEADAAAKVRSDALFHEGLRQWEAGDVAGACGLLEQSYKLLPRTGTLLNLGDCHKQLGQLVRARRELREARDWALRDGQTERVAAAENTLRAIEAELS